MPKKTAKPRKPAKAPLAGISETEFDKLAERVCDAVEAFNHALRDACEMSEMRVEVHPVYPKPNGLPLQLECSVFRMVRGVLIFSVVPEDKDKGSVFAHSKASGTWMPVPAKRLRDV